ncbi:GNAT family N-acetyltransferase [Terriglobus roseus]|uniref:Acetyltransferase (GNAT) domain-containing protein n=1 Tax=Terriglobus roseus TaxID=392734 RepID=A0A1H4R1X3_9BACT|nr:GNAT family N-acetyltransferase [Terriglobus roseus]SEC25865.1 Acetyltransferase (GNAT) domain-containing protein [Terriglobus roseus]
MHHEYSLFEEVPDPVTFCQLRVDAGMSPRSIEAATAGLPRTIFGVLVRHAGKVVGMGRVVGDGGLCFQVSDIAVHPDHQARGLGKALVSRIVAYLHENVPAGSFVNLLADGEAHRLYAQFGFRPTAPGSIGMDLVIDRTTRAAKPVR